MFKISNFRWNILQWHEFRCFYAMSAHKNTLRIENMGQSLVKNIQSSKNLMKCYTVEWFDLGKLN